MTTRRERDRGVERRIEMHDGDGRERKIVPLSGNVGDQLSGEGQDSCCCQEFSSRVRRGPDEDVNPSKDESTYATSRDLTISIPFLRKSQKSNEFDVIGITSYWFDTRIDVAAVDRGRFNFR